MEMASWKSDGPGSMAAWDTEQVSEALAWYSMRLEHGYPSVGAPTRVDHMQTLSYLGKALGLISDVPKVPDIDGDEEESVSHSIPPALAALAYPLMPRPPGIPDDDPRLEAPEGQPRNPQAIYRRRYGA